MRIATAAGSRTRLLRLMILLVLAAGGVSARVAAGPPASGDAPGTERVADLIVASHERRQAVTRGGMLALGGWATANILTGVPLALTNDGSSAAFWEMNTLWNTVNLALAVGGGVGSGLFGEALAQPPADSLAEEIRRQHAIEKTLLFNAGIDLGYMMTGVWMIERAHTGRRLGSVGPQRLDGWGQALIVQGAFLFAFDVILATLQARARPYETALPTAAPSAIR